MFFWQISIIKNDVFYFFGLCHSKLTCFFFSGTFCVNSDGSTAPVFHHEGAEKPGTLSVFGLKISADCVLIATLMTYMSDISMLSNKG